MFAHVGRDNGADLVIRGLKVNVITTSENANWRRYSVQVPKREAVTSDVYLYAMADLNIWQVRLIGYCTGSEMSAAPILENRPIPCRGVSVGDLHSVKDLLELV